MAEEQLVVYIDLNIQHYCPGLVRKRRTPELMKEHAKAVSLFKEDLAELLARVDQPDAVKITDDTYPNLTVLCTRKFSQTLRTLPGIYVLCFAEDIRLGGGPVPDSAYDTK